MPAQDDARERQMIDRFNLVVPDDRGRSDIDAYLQMPEIDEPLPFELKSATGNSVSTVRDFGPEHIAKWRHLHWLFAFYDQAGTHMLFCYYASPADMQRWILEKESYVRPDMLLAEQALHSLDSTIVDHVFGDGLTLSREDFRTADSTIVDVGFRDISIRLAENLRSADFSVDEAKSVMKRQWSAAEYKERADLPGNRYSRDAMHEVLRARLGYLIRRGSTLNNPHIPGTYFEEVGLQKIVGDHAATLRRLVREYLDSGDEPAPLDPAIAAQASAAETDDATA